VELVKDLDGVCDEMSLAEAQDRFGVPFENLDEPAFEFLRCSFIEGQSTFPGQVQKDVACSFVFLD
jgi:hypothetical protein